MHALFSVALQEDEGELAMKAKATENLVFAVAGTADVEKQFLSYTKTELILQCSFNGRDCDMEKYS